MMEKSNLPIKWIARRPFESLFDWPQSMRRLVSDPLSAFPRSGTDWVPSLDAYEKDNTLFVKTDLPGIDKDEVEVTLDNGDLVIRGERKSDKEVKEEDYYCMERFAGSFCRRMALPFEVKPEQIRAKFRDGTLEIQIPKPAEGQPRTHRVKVH